MTERGDAVVLVRWIIVIFYVVFILVFSGSPASSAQTMTSWFWKWLPNLSRAQIQALVFYMRKGLHVSGYFLATIIIFQAISATPQLKRYPYSFSFLLTTLFAVFDEWQQSSLPFRTGSIKDVGLDLAGISLALLIIKIQEKRKKRAPNY